MTTPIEDQARERFDEFFGTLDDAVQRKATLATPIRYAIVSYLQQTGDVTREELNQMVVDEDVEKHVNELIEAGLAVRVGGPPDHPEEIKYRVMHIGRQEIEGDVENMELRE